MLSDLAWPEHEGYEYKLFNESEPYVRAGDICRENGAHLTAINMHNIDFIRNILIRYYTVIVTQIIIFRILYSC